jgi:hypothetical protein
VLPELLPQVQQEQERQVPLGHLVVSWLQLLLLEHLVLPELGWLEQRLAPQLMHHPFEMQLF